MDHFNYRNGTLFAEDCNLSEVAERHDTPCYVYSRATLERHWRAFDDAFADHPHLVCYAVKANSNLAVLNLFARLGSGFDIVSVGELQRVLAAGGDASRVVFSGVGKRVDEMRAALEAGIRCFNMESTAELDRLNQVAGELGVVAPVSLRVNPDVDAKTHPYISTGLKENKFGVEISTAREQYQRIAAMPHLRAVGLDCHIGSQLTELAPFMDALERVLTLAEQLRSDGTELRHLDLGGGLGVPYRDETPPSPAEYSGAILSRLGGTPYELLIEPGRAIAANAGVLLTRVEFLKHNGEHNFAIVDAAMNDLMRPALYQSWQDIVAVTPRDDIAAQTYDIVGPICETGDFLGKQRELALAANDLLAVRSAGAYGFSMSSTYNSRPRVAEIMVDGADMHVVRERETVEDLFAGEQVLPA
ncbi:MAG TPA: diaminopimelate decarboxylase [Chromatiaceae bacterium]|nr:diaminopimelate decarboxylase [Chromatiaceae bacterium]